MQNEEVLACAAKMMTRYARARQRAEISKQMRPVGRGRCSSRRVRTFEDALVWRLDFERCLSQMAVEYRVLLVLLYVKECTSAEAADRMDRSERWVSYTKADALNQLGQLLMRDELLHWGEQS